MYRLLRYSPFLSQLVVTRRCNLSCKYCFEFDDHSEPVPLEQLKARVDKVASLGSFALELTGGEPLLHPHIVELVAHARPHRFTMLGMITNAFLLDRQKVEALNQAGLTDMQVSVDGVEPNNITVKVLRPLRRKLEMLARHARFRVILSGVVGSSAPYGEVAEVITFAKDHGFRPRVLLLHGQDGQLGLDPAELSTYRRVQRLIGRHIQDLLSYQERLIRGREAPFRCRAGSRYLYIDEHGLVHWCSQTRDEFSKPLMEYTHADLKQQFYTYKDCHPRCTIGCARNCSWVDRFFSQLRT